MVDLVMLGNGLVRYAVMGARAETMAVVYSRKAGVAHRDVEEALVRHRESYRRARDAGVSSARLAVLVRTCKTLALYK